MADQERAVTAQDLRAAGFVDKVVSAFPDHVGGEWRVLRATSGSKKLETPYLKVFAKDSTGVTALCDNKGQIMVDHFNYGYDLARRTPIRDALLAANVDPAERIEKAAKLIVKANAAAGLTISLDAARAQIEAQIEAAA